LSKEGRTAPLFFTAAFEEQKKGAFEKAPFELAWRAG
jgi:hypothetical protein